MYAFSYNICSVKRIVMEVSDSFLEVIRMSYKSPVRKTIPQRAKEKHTKQFSKMLVLISSVICVLLLKEIACEEPQCSKFHYEAQMLDKMIRMEVKVEAMEKEIQLKTNQLVLESLEALKNERETFKTERSDFNKAFTDMKDTLLTPDIAFKARHVTDLSLETDQTIVFSTIMQNEGGAYDNITGIFTAPVAGTYLFTTHFCVNNGKFLYYGIVCDNVVYTRGVYYEGSTPVCNSADAILTLRPGQKIWVKCTYGQSGDILYQTDNKAPPYNYWNTFSGTLIHK